MRRRGRGRSWKGAGVVVTNDACILPELGWPQAKEVLVAPVRREKIAGATILSQVFTLSSSESRMAVKAGGLAYKELGIEEDVLMELVKKGGERGGRGDLRLVLRSI